MRILALDLGLSNSAFHLLDSTSGVLAEGKVSMRPASLLKLFERSSAELVVMEIGPLAALVHDLALSLGQSVQVADTTEDAWSWRRVKRKTDRDDARKLAQLALHGQIRSVHIPVPVVRSWRSLILHRQRITRDLTQQRNRIRGLLVREALFLPPGQRAWTLAGQSYLWSESRELEECSAAELWRGMLRQLLERLEVLETQLQEADRKLNEIGEHNQDVQRVRTIPGIGPRTAEAIVSALDGAQRFRSRRQVSAYAGLTPKRYQSGQMDRQGRISKRGNRALRALLNQAAWSSVRYNARMRALYLRLGGANRAHRKRAIVAVMKRLLIVAWALLRRQTDYQEQAEVQCAA